MYSIINRLLGMLCIVAAFSNCNSPQKKDVDAANNAPVVKTPAANFLSMKVNGVSWQADHDITAIVHPKGYNNALLIAGNKGPKDKTEQTFNLNLYNVSGPGIFDFASGNKDNCEVQLANLSDEHYLYGNVLGFSFHVQLTTVAQNPTAVEASFEGTLTGNTGDSVKITEGKFYYHE